jgi:hypothetical protein
MKKLLMVSNRAQWFRGMCGSALLLLATSLVYLAFWMTPAVKAEDKCTICHVPPGNPPNAHTITVGCSAVDAHLRNHPGDCLGPCPCQVTGTQNP